MSTDRSILLCRIIIEHHNIAVGQGIQLKTIPLLICKLYCDQICLQEQKDIFYNHRRLFEGNICWLRRGTLSICPTYVVDSLLENWSCSVSYYRSISSHLIWGFDQYSSQKISYSKNPSMYEKKETMVKPRIHPLYESFSSYSITVKDVIPLTISVLKQLWFQRITHISK